MQYATCNVQHIANNIRTAYNTESSAKSVAVQSVLLVLGVLMVLSGAGKRGFPKGPCSIAVVFRASDLRVRLQDTMDACTRKRPSEAAAVEAAPAHDVGSVMGGLHMNKRAAIVKRTEQTHPVRYARCACVGHGSAEPVRLVVVAFSREPEHPWYASTLVDLSTRAPLSTLRTLVDLSIPVQCPLGPCRPPLLARFSIRHGRADSNSTKESPTLLQISSRCAICYDCHVPEFLQSYLCSRLAGLHCMASCHLGTSASL
jgi:hypothetical protein